MAINLVGELTAATDICPPVTAEGAFLVEWTAEVGDGGGGGGAAADGLKTGTTVTTETWWDVFILRGVDVVGGGSDGVNVVEWLGRARGVGGV